VLARGQTADPADDVGVLRQAQASAGVVAPGRVEVETGQVDSVGDDLDAGGGHAPAFEAAGDRGGDGDRGVAEALAGEIERADARRQPPALHLGVAEGMLGGDHGPDARETGGQTAVDAGAVEVGVDQVVATRADQPDQAGERGQVVVGAHIEVVHADAVGDKSVGDGARIGEGRHLAVDGEVPQQQAELLFGAADAETGDDVQRFHVTRPPRGAGAAGAACV
jgi:hypothetical protein